MESLWQRLRKRKLVEWTIGYAAAGFAVLELGDVLADAFSWPAPVLRVLTVVIAFGFVATLIVAWYHGEKGHQRAPATEILSLVAVAVLALATSWLVAVTTPEEPAARRAPDRTSRAQGAAEAQLALFDPSTATHSVAVLPFVNISSTRQDDYLADGITEDIITQVGKIEGLRVISRTSVMRYRGTEKSIRQIGAELGVGTILEGSVRVQGDRVRIVAQLIDVATDGHLWAETYDRELKDILAVQAEVAAAIAKALGPELRPGFVVAAEEIRTTDAEAYREYLRGRQLSTSSAESERQQAAQHLEAAIRLDPDFAAAWAALADLQTPIAMDAAPPAQPRVDQAMSAAEKAIELNPGQSDAQSALAVMRAFRTRDLAGAVEATKQAVQSNPNSVSARLRHANILFSTGHPEEALREARAAVALDPLSPMVHGQLGEMAYAAGQMPEADAHLKRAIALDSAAFVPRLTLGLILRDQGKTQDAIRELERAAALAPDDPGVLASLGYVLGGAGRTQEARAIVSRLEKAAQEGRPVHGQIAQVYMGLGENERAADWLKRGVGEGRRPMFFVAPRARASFAELEKNPEWSKMLDSLGIRVWRIERPDPPGPPPRTPDSRSRTGDRR